MKFAWKMHALEESAPFSSSFLNARLKGGDGGPAYDGAANRTPASVRLVDRRRGLSLLLQCALRGDLGIGDVADRKPWRRAVTEGLRHHAKHSVPHLRDVAEALKLEMIVRGVEAEEVGCHDRLRETRRRDDCDRGRPGVVGRQLRSVGFEKGVRLRKESSFGGL